MGNKFRKQPRPEPGSGSVASVSKLESWTHASRKQKDKSPSDAVASVSKVDSGTRPRNQKDESLSDHQLTHASDGEEDDIRITRCEEETNPILRFSSTEEVRGTKPKRSSHEEDTKPRQGLPRNSRNEINTISDVHRSDSAADVSMIESGTHVASKQNNDLVSDNEPKLLCLTGRNPCVVVCNVKFKKQNPMFGYKADKENIINTFNELNFEVDVKDDLTGDEMRNLFKDKDFSGAECILCFILTHGNEDDVLCGTDEDVVDLDEILSPLCRNDQLKGKPKLFFIQACRGVLECTTYEVNEEYHKAGPKLKINSKFHDTFVYYSTTEGEFVLVHEVLGSSFIGNVCDMLKEHSDAKTLSELVVMINDHVSSGKHKATREPDKEPECVFQAPEVASTLDYDIVFNRERNDRGMALGAVKPDICLKKNFCFVVTNSKCSHEMSYNFENDRKSMVDTFKQLNCEVDSVKNCTKDKMQQEFTSLFSKDYSDYGSFVGVVLACGGTSGYVNTIYGTDGQFYAIDTIISRLSKVETLRGKPKLLFMLFTRHIDVPKKTSGVERNPNDDQPSKEFVPCNTKKFKAEKSDSFVFYSTISGEKRESDFISSLSQVLKDYSRMEYPLRKVVTKVNDLCRRGGNSNDIPEVCHTLTRDIFFQWKDGRIVRDANEGGQDYEDFFGKYKQHVQDEQRKRGEIKENISGSFKDTDTTPEDILTQPYSVLVSGEAGMGKTRLANHLLYQWACGASDGMICLKYDCKNVDLTVTQDCNIAPLHFSEVGKFIGTDKEYLTELNDDFVKKKAKGNKMIMIIDGVDEISIDSLLTQEMYQELEYKIEESEEITGMETLLCIFFGLLYTDNKVIVLGRNDDIETFSQVQGQYMSTSLLFDENKRKRYELN